MEYMSGILLLRSNEWCWYRLELVSYRWFILQDCALWRDVCLVFCTMIWYTYDQWTSQTYLSTSINTSITTYQQDSHFLNLLTHSSKSPQPKSSFDRFPFQSLYFWHDSALVRSSLILNYGVARIHIILSSVFCEYVVTGNREICPEMRKE